MNEEEITQFEVALENLPEEVKDFLYGEGYKNALDSLTQTYQFTDEQKSTFDLALTDVICLLDPKDALIELFTTWGFPQGKQALLVKDIEEKVFMPIIEATNYIVEEEEGEVIAPERATVIKNDPYKELEKRFVYGTPIVKPGEGISFVREKVPLPPRPPTNDPSAPATPARSIDPYREKPE